MVFVTRYSDLLWNWVSFYNFVMKLFFIGSSCYVLYLMKFKFRYAISWRPDSVGRTLIFALDQLMILPSTHSKLNTSSGPVWSSASSSTITSSSTKSYGRSPSSSSPLQYSHNYSCCKGRVRRKRLRLTTSPLWERIGLSIFRTGFIGTFDNHS